MSFFNNFSNGRAKTIINSHIFNKIEVEIESFEDDLPELEVFHDPDFGPSIDTNNGKDKDNGIRFIH